MQTDMAFALGFDRGRNVLLVTFGMLLARQQHQAMVAAVRALVARQGVCDAIVDFSAVDAFGLDLDYLRALAQAPVVLKGQKRVLVAPDDYIFGTLRVFETHQSLAGEEPMIVRSMAKALALLGIDAPDFQPLPTAD
jgi:hypothetical protein